jgi:hypothetical protein
MSHVKPSENFSADAGPVGSSVPETPAPAYAEEDQSRAPGLLPTVSQPFNFPSNADAELPAYSASSSSSAVRPIAIPQVRPGKTSPFIPCYAPVLLQHGITDTSWRAFLDTISAFLTAKVSDRAVSHAADMARHMGDGPKRLGQNFVDHAKSVGKDISSNAKRGNIFGAALGTIGGAVTISLNGALNAVAAVTSTPAYIIGAIAKKPQTPYERALAYAAVANEKWLQARGLQAQIMDTNQLAQLVQSSTTSILDATQGSENALASGQLNSLQPYIEELAVQDKGRLEIAIDTLWLVLIPVAPPVQQADATSG